MEYIKLANVLRKNMIKYGFLWIFDDFWANPLSDILPCILFRAVAQPSVVPWRGRTQVVRRRPTLHLRCRHVPLHAASGLGWRVGILRVPLQGEPWDTKTTTQSTSCTSAVWRFHRHILGFYMVLPNGYEWRFCQAPALQGSRTHVGSHFELCWNEPLFVTYGPATLQVDGDCPTCHWNVFFSWFCSHGLSNDFFLLIHTFPGSADIMRGRCLAWRFGQPCVFPSQSLGGDLGVAPQMFFFEQSTIQQKDGILTFSHHPNSHPSINSRMANKCGMMGCHSDHSSPVQVKVNPWFAISLCLYELTRQLDWEERRGSLKCIGGFLAATDPGGNRCWNISKKHGDFIETPLERIESISRKPSKTAEV